MHYQKYFTTGKNLPKKLSDAEFNKYFQDYLNGNLEAKEQLILHNLRLVSKTVYTKFANYPDKEELVSEGIIGLIKAL